LIKCWQDCDYRDIVAELRRLKLFDNHRAEHSPQHEADTEANAARRSAYALDKVWLETLPPLGTPVETYLAMRKIDLRKLTADAHASIRYSPRCPRPKDEYGNHPPPLPAMVCLVRHIRHGPIGIHRTFLLPDGSGKARVDPDKASLGPIAGGAVWFGMPCEDEWLATGEGIENVLSVAQSRGLSAAWPALSTSGLRSLVLPAEARMVLIVADNDGNCAGQRAARDAANRFLREGRRVKIVLPPTIDQDFNDILIGDNTTKGARND
jgi:hypothetical protein